MEKTAKDLLPAARHSSEVMQAPMKRVCERLKLLGLRLASRNGLEFFAREGDWQTVSYAREIAQLDAWELDPKFEAALHANLPRAHIRIGDSFTLAKHKQFAGKFDFIVFDNPQGLFGHENQYCEHFEALELTSGLMKLETVAIFNVNREPFNYNPRSEWAKRRREFYGRSNTSLLEKDFLLSFYRGYFQALGLELLHSFVEPRHDRYLAYFVAVLARK